jgi:hypothetical protein
MATEAKSFSVRVLASEHSPAENAGGSHTQVGNFARVLHHEVTQARAADILFCHHTSDRQWVIRLSERVRREHFGKRNLGIALNCLGSPNSRQIVEEVETHFRAASIFAIVISSAMMRTEWPALENVLKVLSRFPSASGRVLAILRDNVNLPAFLRVREWIDFRDDGTFEESTQDLLRLLEENIALHSENSSATATMESKRQFSSRGMMKSPTVSGIRAQERIVSNLFPVVETPKVVFSAETPFRTDAEVAEVCGQPGPLPFLLRESRLYTFQPLNHDSIFAPALSKSAAPRQESFTRWFSDSERAGWAISFLNNLLRNHAWKRGLRFDAGRNLHYFTRSKPKNVWWQIGKQVIPREVTAPRIESIQLENQMNAEVQYGWRHRSIRADFMQIMGALFLRLEPAWHLTELDGKTAASAEPVGPALSDLRENERNGQVLRSLRFWSVVLAKGHQELRINTGSNPLRARLVPTSGFSQQGIQNDHVNYDSLMLAEMQDDLSIPELRPIKQERAINYEEDLSSGIN